MTDENPADAEMEYEHDDGKVNVYHFNDEKLAKGFKAVLVSYMKEEPDGITKVIQNREIVFVEHDPHDEFERGFLYGASRSFGGLLDS